MSQETNDVVHKDVVREDGATPAGTFEATYYRPYHMHGSIGTSAAVATLDEAEQHDDDPVP